MSAQIPHNATPYHCGLQMHARADPVSGSRRASHPGSRYSVAQQPLPRYPNAALNVYHTLSLNAV